MARTVPELIGIHAEADPERPALITWDGGERHCTTYAGLQQTTTAIAAGLRGQGMRRGDRLGLCLDNADAGAFYRLLYGAYRGGFVPVPVNTRLALPEVTHIIRDARISLLVARSEAIASLVSENLGECELLPLDALSDLETTGGPVPPAPGLDDAADLMYTSGTTGLPKGSAFRHRSLALNSERLAKVLRFGTDDVFQTPAPVYTSTGSHTLSLPALHAGATFVVEPSFEIEKTADRLAEEGTTIFFGVPAMLMLLLSKLPSDRALPRLRALMYGGSPIPEQVIPKLLERFPGAGLWNLYGLTEGGPTGCVLPPEQALERPGSVGCPVTGTELRILDEDDNEVEAGEPGEIVLRSETVMDGYYGAPEATAEVLVDGWMHTGDLGSVDSDGYVYILGRTKDMIIRGGFNVYPAEIEHVLHDHPDVTEAAVVGVPHDVLGEEVCAVVALRPGAETEVEELKALCAERLADFKRPKRWDMVQKLPRNSMGKVMKAELRERYGTIAGKARE